MGARVTVQRLTGSIGAEVNGIILNESLDDATFAAIHLEMDLGNIEWFTEDLITTLVIAFGSGGVAAAAIVFLTRSWISERLKQSIAHEYAQKIEAFRAELNAKQEVAIERIRSAHSLAATSFVESRKAAQERLLNAMEVIWQAVLQVSPLMPAWVTTMDCLTADEWREKLRADAGNMEMDRRSVDTFVERLYKGMLPSEQARLFGGEYAYALLYAFRAISGRIVFLHELSRHPVGKPWHQDAAVRQLIGLILSEDEVQMFDGRIIGHYSLLGNAVKQKLTATARALASSSQAAQEALDQARLIVESASKLR
jgi:hypothetical protein